MSVQTSSGREYGPFRVYFEFKGVNGTVEEFVTIFRDEESDYPSLEDEATAIATRVGEETYNADPETVSVTNIAYRPDYEDRMN